MKRMLVVALVVAAGCGPSIATRADEAYKRRQYLEAAELYDQVVRAEPKNGKALEKRTAARTEVLRELLAATTQARVAGQEEIAEGKLAEMLVRRDTWQMSLDPQTQKTLTVEVVALGSAIAGAVEKTSGASGPLSAEQLALHYAPMLAHQDFASWRKEINDSVQSAGRAACQQLAPRATTPYWSWLVASYCRHWGGEEVRMLSRPNLRTGLVVEGSLAGIPPEDSARIRDTLAGAFKDSVWFWPQAPRSAHAQLGGRLAVAYDAHTVTRTANWTEQVPYTVYVDEQESYQEPYDDTETYTEQVPHTEYHSCGDTTCPETVYSSETRTRTVTKYRTAYRTVTRPETRYRDEPRSFQYEAIERSGKYTSALRVRLDRDQPDVSAEITGNFFEHGFDHDASNPAAGVSPERANLPTLADFTAREEGRLRDELRAKLDRRYGELYCTAPRFDLEGAAACAYLAPGNLPPAVHAALHGAFGADEMLLAGILTR